MKFPNLKTARVLNEEEMLRFRGGACNSGCKSGCSSSCKTGCSPGNKNNRTIDISV
ncbi:MAG: hypothetical protein Q4B43_03400 [Bacteroidota bacterium]|nr:hypothetical protein [Bacteroidota bacterium]